MNYKISVWTFFVCVLLSVLVLFLLLFLKEKARGSSNAISSWLKWLHGMYTLFY